MNDLVRLTARQAVDLLRRRDASPLEMIDAALEKIEETDGVLNALPTLCADRAREHAVRLADVHPDDAAPGYLYGLPIAIKDLKDVAGVRSTRGSPIFADHVPNESDLLVTTLESKGGVVLAKSNTPEFGAGANTFNEVFGKTRNPWNTATTCGGCFGWVSNGPGSGTGVAGQRQRPRRQS